MRMLRSSMRGNWKSSYFPTSHTGTTGNWEYKPDAVVQKNNYFQNNQTTRSWSMWYQCFTGSYLAKSVGSSVWFRQGFLSWWLLLPLTPFLLIPCNSCNYYRYVNVGVKFSRHWDDDTLCAEQKQNNPTLVNVTRHNLQTVSGQQYLIKRRLLYISSQQAQLPEAINGPDCTVYMENTNDMQLCCL